MVLKSYLHLAEKMKWNKIEAGVRVLPKRFS